MKKIKLLITIYLLTIVFIGFNSCKKDDMAPASRHNDLEQYFKHPDILFHDPSSKSAELFGKEIIDYTTLYQWNLINSFGEYYPVGDTDGDGKNEVLYCDKDEEKIRIKGKDQNANFVSEWVDHSFDPIWDIYPIGDSDGDRMAEIFFYSPVNGKAFVLGNDGNGNYVEEWSSDVFEKGLEVYPVGDSDGDSRTEILLYDREAGKWTFFGSNHCSNYFEEWFSTGIRSDWEIFPIGDSDGDNRTEIFLYDRDGEDGPGSTGAIYGNSGNESYGVEWQSDGFSPGWDVYAVGDVDGNGKTEFFLYGKNGINSRGIIYGQGGNGYHYKWEGNTFIDRWEIYPVGDVDGDDKAEFFLYERINGTGLFYGKNGNGYAQEWEGIFETTWRVHPVGDVW